MSCWVQDHIQWEEITQGYKLQELGNTGSHMRKLSAPNFCTLCAVLSYFRHVQLCDTMDCRLPGSSDHGILQARILEWVVMPSSRGCSRPRDQTHFAYISCIGRRLLYHQCHSQIPCTPSVQFSHSVMFNSLRPHESQHARPPCPSPTLNIAGAKCIKKI